MADFPRITRPSHVIDKPCIRDTGITVAAITALLSNVPQKEDVLRMLPVLTMEDLNEALAFTAWWMENPDMAASITAPAFENSSAGHFIDFQPKVELSPWHDQEPSAYPRPIEPRANLLSDAPEPPAGFAHPKKVSIKPKTLELIQKANEKRESTRRDGTEAHNLVAPIETLDTASTLGSLPPLNGSYSPEEEGVGSGFGAPGMAPEKPMPVQDPSLPRRSRSRSTKGSGSQDDTFEEGAYEETAAVEGSGPYMGTPEDDPDEILELYHPDFPDKPTVTVNRDGFYDRRWETGVIAWTDIQEIERVNGHKLIKLEVRNPEHYFSQMPFLKRVSANVKMSLSLYTFEVHTGALNARTKDLYFAACRLWRQHRGDVRLRKKRRVRVDEDSAREDFWKKTVPK